MSDRLIERKAQIAVIGLGYVGLPLAIATVQSGFSVLGIDRDAERVESLRRGETNQDIDEGLLSELSSSSRVEFTQTFDGLRDADAIVICVPTPLSRHREPDMSYIERAMDAIAPHLRAGQLLILESTTYPGTTEELLSPYVERQGFTVGQDLFVAFSPERVDPGNAQFPLQAIPKIVGGVTEACTAVAKAFYDQVIEGGVHTVSSPRVAETEKLLENIFRNVNVALVNELAQLCDRMGIDIWEVIEAASTKPYGFMPFYPGPGLGGHCIPVDPFYLSWKAREHEFNVRFIELAGEVNARMPEFVVAKLSRLLNRDRKPLNGSRILILGVAYKRDISDTRESPALKVMSILLREGAEIRYHDRFVPQVNVDETSFQSVELDQATLETMDAVVLITDHSEVDYDRVVRHSNLVFDTRNVLKQEHPHVHRL